MAISVVKTAGATTAGATSLAPAFASNVAIGNIVVAVIHGAAQDVSSFSGFGVSMWRQLRREPLLATGGFVYIMAGVATTATTTATINFAASTAASATLLEVSGGSLFLDALNASDEENGTNTPIIQQLQTLTNGDLIIAVGAWASNSTVSSSPSGYTMATAQVSTGVGLSVGYQVQGTAGNLASTHWALSVNASNIGCAVALLAATPANANPQLVQTATNKIHGLGTLTLMEAPQPGNTLIVYSGAETNAAGTSLSDGTNTYTMWSDTTSDGANQARLEIFTAPVVSTGSITITASASSGGFFTIVVEEWTNISATPNIVGTGNGSLVTNAVTTGSITPTVNNCLLIAAVAVSKIEPPSAGPTGLASGPGSSDGITATMQMLTGHGVLAAPASISSGWTIAATAAWSSNILAFGVTVPSSLPGLQLPTLPPRVNRAPQIYALAGRSGYESSPLVAIPGGVSPPPSPTRIAWNAVQAYIEAGRNAYDSSAAAPVVVQSTAQPLPVQTKTQWNALRAYQEASRSAYDSSPFIPIVGIPVPRPVFTNQPWYALQIYAEAGRSAYDSSPFISVPGGITPQPPPTRTQWNAIEFFVLAGRSAYDSSIGGVPVGPSKNFVIRPAQAVQSLTIQVLQVSSAGSRL